ncbi:MAG: hypothetical protein A2Y40_03500 [Candidatus Margulisbacteria bacterium GWF2_35_9]|nr:MAG: hypothetical protein A2Y40_03500 [Candidatus Margulisbacteria bacterium GWF2_35_9]
MIVLEPQFIHKLIDILLSKGGNFSDIYIEEDEMFSFVLENNVIKTIKTGNEGGVHLRVISDDKSYCAYANEIIPDKLEILAGNIADSLSAGRTNQAKNIDSNLNFITTSKLHLGMYESCIRDFLDTSKKIYVASPKICQATLSFSQSFKRIWIANSDGLVSSDERQYSRYMINVVAKDGSITETAYEGPGITGDQNIFDLYPLETTSEKVVKRVLASLNATQAPLGKMPVVLMGEAGGTMIHEACGHAFEADFIYKDTSIFGNKMGQKIASDNVTVIDDGSIPGLYGSFSIDDEGVEAKKTVLIENGVLKGYMTDRLSAGLLNIPLTGNGRRESFRSKPIPRMSNTFIENQNMIPEEILSTVSNGILVKRMGGGQVNITNGEFIFEISEGYEIKNGKVTNQIRGASMIGNGPDVLNDIESVGNDKCFLPGVCGKFDHVPVSDAQPTIKIKQMTIGGK